MPAIFKIGEIHDPESDNPAGVRVEIALRIGDRETACPVSAVCRSTKELVREVRRLQAELDRVREEGERVLGRGRTASFPDFGPETPPREIWETLSCIAEDDVFVETFNAMDESVRSRVVEYILSHCSLFSGKGAVFSARYNSDTRLMQ